MRRRKQNPPVPAVLVQQIDAALEAVDAARADLKAVLAAREPLAARRLARTRLDRAFAAADPLLRQAATQTRAAIHTRPGAYVTWSQWRRRLSRLDTQWQMHQFAGLDDVACPPIGSIRTIDTGMSGPDIGDLQHGHSREPGTPATYGLDIESVLTGVSTVPRRFTDPVRAEVAAIEPPATERPVTAA